MTNYHRLNASKTFSELPAENPNELMQDIRRASKALNRTIVVLDDDPTGTQTVFGIEVLTDWTVPAIQEEFDRKVPIFYILTNSRSMPSEKADELAKEIGKNLLSASQATGRDFFVISRSDSTLRGHYPNEVEALLQVLQNENHVRFLVPAFFDGGRYTINNIHYVQEGQDLVPASETAFAQDKAFGFKHSDLTHYVEEKTGGKLRSDQMITISIDDLRIRGLDFVREKISNIPDGCTCIVNAASDKDLQVFALALLRSEKKAILRTAASIVPIMAGMEKKPLMSSKDFKTSNKGGVLLVIGSYVPKTTAQLHELEKENDLNFIEVDVQTVISKRDGLLNNYLEKVNRLIAEGVNVVVFTSRSLVSADDQSKNLQIGNEVSDFMTALVSGLTSQPKCILAKGGITSSDTATVGLKVKKAMVKGQVAPGIPVWELGSESKFPGMKYIVFPGNVGDNYTLRKVYRTIC